MKNLKEQLQEDIKVLVKPLLEDEEQIIEILRRRLTKKEWKYYKCKLEKLTIEDTCKELNCDSTRLEEIEKQTKVKLNQEKIKQEITA